MSDSPLDDEQVSLQLGDIIEIEAPTDDRLHAKTFYIEYIDSKEINIIADGIEEVIKLNDDGSLQNESITAINILNRASEGPGYAQQNMLIPGKWIDVHFSGDVPVVITGKITNLDKDQIEIRLFEGEEVIYIDFSYKGIPKNIPIDKIIVREEPEIIKSQEAKAETEIEAEEIIEPGKESTDEKTSLEELIPIEGSIIEDIIPVSEIKEQIRNVILEADQLQIGMELEEITQIVDVPEAEKRYGIDKQTDDLLDELLSTIPNIQRTQDVLNNIHTMIQRFKQLRSEFSDFDEQNNANKPLMKGANYKPLVETLKKLNKKLYWLLPVARMNKKLYDLDEDIESEYSDIVPLTLAETRVDESEIINTYLDNSVPSGENKYVYLLRSLQPYLTPYEQPDSLNEYLTTMKVEESITAVIDNLDDFYNSVSHNDEVKRKRFLIQEYGLGQNMLESEKTKGGKVIIKNKKVTNNDTITIKSLLTLPLSVVNFSHINLPSSNIMLKSNLNKNFLTYWKFLNENTIVSSTIVDKTLEHNENDFLRRITEYVPNSSIEENKYEQFLDSVIPKTRVLFNLIKNNIRGKLSVYEILHYLEPFMIYHKDLSYKQYEEFVKYINDKIKAYKINYVTQRKRLEVFKINSNKPFSYLIKLLNTEPVLAKEVFEAYGLNELPQNDGVFISQIIAVDEGRLFNTALAKTAITLMMPDGVLQLDELETWAKETKREINTNETECNIYPKTIAKKYLTVDELQYDNNNEDIFYDKRYDKTYYDIIDEYKQEINNLGVQEQIAYIANKLETKNGISKELANQDAEAMVTKKRKVRNGDYAILEDDNTAEGVLYYQRIDNVWEIDKNITSDQFIENDKLFCNLNKSCVFVDKRCEDNNNALTLLQDDNIKKIVNEFDDNLKKNLDNMTKIISLDYQLALERAYLLRKFLFEDKLKYNNLHFDIGGSIDIFDIKRSPYEQLRDAILSQGDIAKKQNYIARFITTFTRPAYDDEDQWWLYCGVTDIKLLPTFFQKLSTVFLMGENYFNALRQICTNQGTISDDESYWVDKHSGYVITAIDWNTDEGYTESGFKVQSREILEADFGDTMVQENTTTKRVFKNPNSERVYRVAMAMEGFLGINIDAHIDFILQNVIKQLGKRMPTKEKYEKAMDALKAKAKGKEKKIDSYEKAFNQLLVILTLCYLVIAIETSVPPIKTRKSFPGCTKSFSSYPLEGEGPPGPGLVYIACVANKIKSSVEPWNSITKLSESSLIKKMDMTIKKYILNTEDIKVRITDKLKYLKTAKTEDIPEYLNIKNWINFLPPLQPVKLGTIENISDTFEDELKRNIKTGSDKQNDKINVMRSKIIYFSIKIQELIQKIISSKSAILSDSNNSPFLENACCNEEGTNTLEYFIKINPSILNYNKYATKLENLLYDVNTLAEASILFDNKDTKPKYPVLSPDFSEDTIYRAFIVYCKQNNMVLFDDKLRAVCMGQNDGIPDYDIKDKIEDKIEKLKRNGYNYSNENLQQLMTIINNRNLVNVKIYYTMTNIERLYSIVFEIDEEDSIAIPRTFIEKLLSMIEPRTELELFTEQTIEMRELKNYLSVSTEQMQTSIIEFLKNNSRKTPKKELIKCIENIINFEISEDTIKGSEETVFKTIQFIKNSIHTICNVLPNIIINSQDYSKISEPKHWNLHRRHYNDIQNFVSKYYSSLKQFYGDPKIKIILNKFQEITKNINILSKNTPYYAPIKDGDKSYFTVFDKRVSELLFKFYFYSVLTDLISIMNDVEEIMKETPIEDSTEDKDLYLTTELIETEQNLSDREIIAGDRKMLGEKIANILTVFMNIVCSDKNTINYSYDSLMERVHRAKEKEKDIITHNFKEMTDEEREIENMFKNNKLEKWSKGLQKGLTIYQKETYDEERDAMEKQIMAEMKIGNNTDIVTEMNRNIYILDEIESQAEADRIETEELRINMPDDDDPGDDYDGDEHY